MAWQCTGAPDAGGYVLSHNASKAAGPSPPSGAFTFEQLFWSVFQALEYSLPAGEEARQYTWMFELCTPSNQVVVKHSESNLYFLGARHAASGREIGAEEALGLGNVAYQVNLVVAK